MSDEIMNTREVAAYLGINEKQVYALTKAKKIPGSRVTGKWVFPKRLIDEWIEQSALGSLKQAKERSRSMEGALLASGSNDPVLDFLLTEMRHLHPEFFFFCANTGSTEGLRELANGYTDIAWTHLFDPESGTYNIPFIRKYLPDMKSVLVHLFRRGIGIIAAPGNPLGLSGIEDLARKKVRFANRQEGSGTRVHLDYYLDKSGIAPGKIDGYDQEVYTHVEVGLSVLSGRADAGLATIAVSRLMGLHFIPLTWENFEMVVDQSTFFKKGIQSLINVLKSPDFRERFERLGGYDFEDAGKIMYSLV